MLRLHVLLRFVLFFCLTPLFTLKLHTACLDSLGNEFWLAIPRAESHNSASITVRSNSAISGSWEVPGVLAPTAFSVAANGSTSILMPPSIWLSSQDGVENLAVHVTTSGPATLLASRIDPETADTWAVWPSQGWGREYLVEALPFPFGSQFAVVADSDFTYLTITPRTSLNTRTAALPYNISLMRGQVYVFWVNGVETDPFRDLSGWEILASKKVGVTVGSSLAYNPGLVLAGDFMAEQLPPLEQWGRDYLAQPFATRGGGDTLRVLAARPNTQLRINGILVATLSRGQAYSGSLSGPSEIRASQPVLVAQYARGQTFDSRFGDPLMLIHAPLEAWQADQSFVSPMTGWNSPIQRLCVLAPNSAISSIRLDGAPLSAPAITSIGSSGYSAVSVTVLTGPHRLSASAGISAMVYAFGNYVSYGHLGSRGFSQSLTPVAQLELNPPTASHYTGELHCVSVTAKDANGDALPNVALELRLSGAHNTVFTACSDAWGQASFCYVGIFTGQDDLLASAQFVSASAQVDWLAPSPTPTRSSSDTATASPSHTPSDTPTGTASGSPTPSATQTATSSATPSFSESASPSPSPASTLSATPSASPSPSSSASATSSVSPSITPSVSPTFSPSPPWSATISPTLSATPSLSPTASASASATLSPTPTASFTALPSLSATTSPMPTPAPLTLRALPPSPNPSDGNELWIAYVLNTAAEVTAQVYDVSGELVRDLGQRFENAGARERLWDCRNREGAKVASGIFIVRLSAISPAGETAKAFVKCSVLR